MPPVTTDAERPPVELLGEAQLRTEACGREVRVHRVGLNDTGAGRVVDPRAEPLQIVRMYPTDNQPQVDRRAWLDAEYPIRLVRADDLVGRSVPVEAPGRAEPLRFC